MEIYGAYNTNGYVYQTVPVNKADVCFNVCGTASGRSTSTLHEDRTFWLELAIRYADDQGNGITKEFSDTYAGDQTVSFTAKPRRTGVVVREVAVTVVYRDNGNGLGFDRAMLNVDMTGTSYSYDGEGNLISAEDNANRNQTYTYSDANELLEMVDAKTSGIPTPTLRTTSISWSRPGRISGGTARSIPTTITATPPGSGQGQ